jgi:hypothetical protein
MGEGGADPALTSDAEMRKKTSQISQEKDSL